MVGTSEFPRLRGPSVALLSATLAALGGGGCPQFTLAAPAARLAGIEAFSSGQSVHATLEVRKLGSLRLALALREFGGAEMRPIHFYDRDMTKYLHLIAVDGGLHSFKHVHPVLDRAGVFHLSMSFPHGGTWHLYAEGIPHNFGREVFRFDVALGGNVPHPSALGRRLTARTGPYAVTLDRAIVPAGALTMLRIRIFRGGRPAQGLRPYLGARAHAVLIGAADLSYIHVHAMSAGMQMNAASMPMPGMPPMSMSMPAKTTPAPGPTDDPCNADAAVGMSLIELPPGAHVAPEMSIMLQPSKPGRYFLWIQFRASAGVFTAPFQIQAR